MDNRILRIGYFLQKLKFCKHMLLALGLVVSVCILPAQAYAIPYGEGDYGAYLYGQDFPASSPASAPTCTETAPKSAPTITLVASKNTTEIELTFAPATDPVTYYALEYGPSSQRYTYSMANIGGRDTRKYTVSALAPGTTYYFRIRAGNGCMPGEWSPEVSGKTTSRVGNKPLTIVNTTITPVEMDNSATETPSTSTQIPKASTGYEVDVMVVNTKNEPIPGATVVIHSDPQQNTTDTNGLAQFKGITEGAHTIRIAYGNYSGEEPILLTGPVKIFKITITVQENNPPFSKVAIGVIAALVGVVILLTAFVIFRRRRT